MIKRTLQLVIFTALLIVTTSMAADARVRTNLWITMPPWGILSLLRSIPVPLLPVLS